MTDETITRARAAVARLREAEGKATAGPWEEAEYDGVTMTLANDGGWAIGADGACRECAHASLSDNPQSGDQWLCDSTGTGANLAAIVALRNAAPALLALAAAMLDDERNLRYESNEVYAAVEALAALDGVG